MKARGKRGAKRSASPWVTDSKLEQGLKGRDKQYYALSALDHICLSVTRGDTLRFASRLPLAVICRAVGADTARSYS